MVGDGFVDQQIPTSVIGAFNKPRLKISPATFALWAVTKEVATVEEGVVNAIKEGHTVITAKTADGEKVANCDVIVLYNYLDDPITFADAKMKKLCINVFDSI